MFKNSTGWRENELGYPTVCSLYCTSWCDNRCGHCLVRSLHPGDAKFDNVERVIRQFDELGGWYVDLTGGNPLIVPWLPEALKECRKRKLFSSVTMSGPLIHRRLGDWGEEWLRNIHTVGFSIDGSEERHNANRGNGYYRYIREGLAASREIRKSQRTQLIFTAMPGAKGNIDRAEFAAVLELAREFGVLVNVNLLFNIEALDERELRDLKWFARQADVQLSKGKIRFVMRGGNSMANPTCAAVKRVLTVSSDNKVVLPCYHQLKKGRATSLPIGNDLKSVLDSPIRRELLARDGRHGFCQGCSIWCYIVPSFLEHLLDRVVVWQHGLSGFQQLRDFGLRMAGRLHTVDRYPRFSIE